MDLKEVYGVYGKPHRMFIQAMLTRGIISSGELKKLFEVIMKRCGGEPFGLFPFSRLICKGQLISEHFFSYLQILQKNKTKNLQISFLASKKWLNPKIKALNTQNMTNPTIESPVKMEYG